MFDRLARHLPNGGEFDSLREDLRSLDGEARAAVDDAVADAENVDDLLAALAERRADPAGATEGAEAGPAGARPPAATDGDDADRVEVPVRGSTAVDDEAVPVAVGAEAGEADGDDAGSAASPVPAGAAVPGALPAVDRTGQAVRVGADRTRSALRSGAASGSALVGRGAREVRDTVREADPEETALWGLGAGLAIANPAIAASYSTYVLLSAGVVGGAAIGAYASSHEESVFNEVDPLTMARIANSGASRGRRLGRDGAVLGAATGVGSYLARHLTPEAYAQWVADADAGRILRGAVMGAEHARRNVSETVDGRAPGLDRAGGALLGGTLGLLYGYVEDSESEASLRELLDEDLYAEYERLAGAGDAGDVDAGLLGGTGGDDVIDVSGGVADDGPIGDGPADDDPVDVPDDAPDDPVDERDALDDDPDE